MNKLKQMWKSFDDIILKGGEPIYKDRTHNFKGQRNFKKEIGSGGPIPTREQYEYEFRLEPELRMQSRKLRLQHMGYFMLYGAWFAGVILFIMYRLKSDDLDQMEKEAEERLRIQRAVKELNEQYPDSFQHIDMRF
ncbi:hypothetical protein PPERSA_03176 [Pseudocohnilembus persalinus]|uniref:Transmembrane protein n=1 Tax=Pseudocohnilembus persalinus TaxID=266149 RepID=A0A0V0QE69_PSEPJ|nr:hypothetical protein PPERSA_03176 [Pseudocohnilembus persalinus]|eukprot:KRX00443.1 hypothetical protein PPERSA_03176 [Pseudocohnilembus persalinus]